MAAKRNWEARQGVLSIQEQFELGIQDQEAGRLDLAQQRFEWVLAKDPAFPGATDRLLQVVSILFITATPTPVTPTPSPTLEPTRDLRPVQELIAQAEAALRESNWNSVIQILENLRGEDPDYRVADIDGMLFIALRNRGIERILQLNDLNGGSYDLALAERFGPLDGEAYQALNLARLYLYGSSFWEAYPEQAVFYFSQVAAASPYLRDASGWTAAARYRAALIQYADQLFKTEKWCEAQEQYELALSMGGDAAVQQALEDAADACNPPTETPTSEATITLTATLTPTMTLTPTGVLPSATPTLPLADTATSTNTPVVDTPTATGTPSPSSTTGPQPATPTSSETPTQEPPTSTPTLPPPATETPTPTLEPPTMTPTDEFEAEETPLFVGTPEGQ
jgi:hypothetical protein